MRPASTITGVPTIASYDSLVPSTVSDATSETKVSKHGISEYSKKRVFTNFCGCSHVLEEHVTIDQSDAPMGCSPHRGEPARILRGSSDGDGGDAPADPPAAADASDDVEVDETDDVTIDPVTVTLPFSRRSDGFADGPYVFGGLPTGGFGNDVGVQALSPDAQRLIDALPEPTPERAERGYPSSVYDVAEIDGFALMSACCGEFEDTSSLLTLNVWVIDNATGEAVFGVEVERNNGLFAVPS